MKIDLFRGEMRQVKGEDLKILRKSCKEKLYSGVPRREGDIAEM